MTDTTIESVAFESARTVKPAPRGKLRKKLLTGLGAGVALSALAYGGYYALVASNYVTTDNAYVGASVAQINSQVSGPIARVAVDDTQQVHKGDVLVDR
jgi:membrane fusion protein (multidrug efflux system)